MSLRVLFVCVSLCAIGLHAAWRVTNAFLEGRVHLDAGLLFLPLAIALMLGFRGARSIANWVFGINYAALALILAVPASSLPDPMARPAFAGFSVLLVATLILFAVLALLHWLLYTPPFDEYLS